MKSARFLGHQIHPMLIVFPLGLLGGSVAFDIVRMVNGHLVFAVVSFWLLAAGLIGGVLAAIFGAWDWLTITEGTRAKRVGLVHGITQAVALSFFGASFYMRGWDPDFLPHSAGQMCAFVGLVVALVGGWLGGELVERLGVGVSAKANLDAPSSLSHEAAEEDRAAQQPYPGFHPHTR
jgi:uncharacterized membrane protein